MAGCITVEGTSSGTMKDAMLQSFLFRSADIFYPRGVPADPAALPALDDRHVRQIEEVLNALLEGLQKRHEAVREELGSALGKPVRPDLRVRIRLVNTGRPLWNITRGSSGESTITADAKVAQAVFRTALLAGLRQDGFAGTKPRESTAGDTKTIAEFLKLKKEVEEAPAGTVIGDLLSGLGKDGLESRWFSMSGFAMLSEKVERHYFSPFIFMLAHEVGHYALDHFSRLPGPQEPAERRCEALREMEQEADLYAVLLPILGPGMALGFGLFGSADMGFENFFAHTYGFAGFPDDRCSHPDPRKRLDSLRIASRHASSRAFERMWKGYGKALEEPEARKKEEKLQ